MTQAVESRLPVMGFGVLGLELQSLLKLLDRLGCLPLRQQHPSAQHPSIRVGRVLLEEAVEHLQRLVVPRLGEGDLGEATPGQKEVGGLRGDLREDPLRIL